MVSRHLKHSHLGWLHPSRGLLLCTFILSAIGLLFVFEASVVEAFNNFGDQYHFLRLQAIRFAIGTAAMIFAYFIPMTFWQKLAPWLYGIGILLLITVFIPGLSREINGAYRWILLGPIRFQPIEYVKLGVVLFFASWMSQHQRFLPFLFLTILPVILVMFQPDLGSVLILLAISFTMYFLAGGELKTFFSISALGVLGLALLIALSPYRMRRVTTFLNPESDPLGASFHIRQITLALGNGGWFGLGIGNSRQKFSYIPEASTDSIFAIVAEEVGFVGSSLIISLFMLYLWFGFRMVAQAEVPLFNKLVGYGILIWITSQIILNLSAVLALVPLTGVPLPFFSYGGSSLVMILFATGILIRSTKS
ncbi:MAG: putative lipid II flippase FtsW [bacterium]|nr:putative lipid II flippase FtsW [bacterium]